MVFAGCLSPDGAGSQTLAQRSSSNLKILKLDVTSDEDVQQAKKTVQENLPEKGEWHSLYGISFLISSVWKLTSAKKGKNR